MNSTVLVVLTFAAAALLVAACYSFLTDMFLRDRDQVRRRINSEFVTHQRNSIQKTLMNKDLAPESSPSVDDDSPPTCARGSTWSWPSPGSC